MKVFFSEKATESVVIFFDLYRDLYFQLYDDTGLWPAEDYIKNQYLESSIQMRDWVYEEIEKILSHDAVLWYVPWDSSSDIRLVTKSYWSYRLFVEYREVATYRIIENVRIYRK